MEENRRQLRYVSDNSRRALKLEPAPSNPAHIVQNLGSNPKKLGKLPFLRFLRFVFLRKLIIGGTKNGRKETERFKKGRMVLH